MKASTKIGENTVWHASMHFQITGDLVKASHGSSGRLLYKFTTILSPSQRRPHLPGSDGEEWLWMGCLYVRKMRTLQAADQQTTAAVATAAAATTTAGIGCQHCATWGAEHPGKWVDAFDFALALLSLLLPNLLLHFF